MKLPVKSLIVLSTAGTMFLSACSNNSNSASKGTDSSSTGSMSSTNTVPMTGTPSAKKSSTKKDSSAAGKIGNTNPDQATVDYLVAGNAKEIAWLMAGEKRTANKEIQAHSKMMLADHTTLGEKLSVLIGSKNLTAPPVDTMGVVTINDLKGKEWDKAWVDKAVKDHQELFEKLKQSEAHVRDSSLRKIVISTEPIVRSHLDMVKKMQDKMK